MTIRGISKGACTYPLGHFRQFHRQINGLPQSGVNTVIGKIGGGELKGQKGRATDALQNLTELPWNCKGLALPFCGANRPGSVDGMLTWLSGTCLSHCDNVFIASKVSGIVNRHEAILGFSAGLNTTGLRVVPGRVYRPAKRSLKWFGGFLYGR